jgi:hypothetical protein
LKIPRSKLRGIFDRKEVCYFQIRSLTPQQAAGNALAFAVQCEDAELSALWTNIFLLFGQW